MPQAATLIPNQTRPRSAESGSDRPSRVSRRKRRGSPRCARRERGRLRVYARAARISTQTATSTTSEPTTIRSTQPSSVTSGRLTQQEGDEREDVEGAVEHHGREPAAARVRAAGHPARAEEIPDAPREHVVHRDAGDDHLDEAALPEPRCRRCGATAPPAASRRPPCTRRRRGAAAAGRRGACPTRRRGRFRESRGRGRRSRSVFRPRPRPRAIGSARSRARPERAKPHPHAPRTSQTRRSRSKHRRTGCKRHRARVAADPSPWSRQALRRASEDCPVSPTTAGCQPGVGLQSDTDDLSGARVPTPCERGRKPASNEASGASSRRAPSRSCSSASSASSSSPSLPRRSSSATPGSR